MVSALCCGDPGTSGQQGLLGAGRTLLGGERGEAELRNFRQERRGVTSLGEPRISCSGPGPGSVLLDII